MGDQELAQEGEKGEAENELCAKARFIERRVAVGGGVGGAAIDGSHAALFRIVGFGRLLMIVRKV